MLELQMIWEKVLGQWMELPGYVVDLVTKWLIPFVIVAVVYLFVLFFSNHFAYVMRWLYVLCCVGILIYGYFRGNWSIMWLTGASLLFLLLYKLIVNGAKSIRQRRKDRKFERKALAKAESRRGSFANKKAYSGTPQPVVPEKYVPEKMNNAEINDVIRNEVSGNTGNLTEILDSIGVPRDPLAEIEETKAELSKAVTTAKFDVEAIEAALEKTEQAKGKES